MLDAHGLLCVFRMEAHKKPGWLEYRRKTVRNKDSSKPILSPVNLYRAISRKASSLTESIPVYHQEVFLLLNIQENYLLKKLKIYFLIPIQSQHFVRCFLITHNRDSYRCADKTGFSFDAGNTNKRDEPQCATDSSEFIN